MDIKKLAIGAALIYISAKFVTNGMAKGAIGSIGAILLAKQTPILKDLL